MTKDLVTIYHIEGRRSVRVVWLCEELGIPYKLIYKRGDLAGSMQMIKDAYPVMPMSPLVEFRGQKIVESGAILEWIQGIYDDGKMAPGPTSPDFPLHLQWFHFAEGTAMYRMWARRYASMVGQIPIENIPDEGLVGIKATYDFMETHLTKYPYFGGSKFSTADIMMQFFAMNTKMGASFDPVNYTKCAEWRKNVESRPAFKRAMDACVPDGANEHGYPKEWPLLFELPKGPAPVPKLGA